MIRAPGAPDPPLPRLLATLAARGLDRRAGSETLVVGAGTTSEPDRLADLFAGSPPARVLVLSAVGAHPDARAQRLRALWAIEERCRESGLPVLTLRLGPLVGPDSPLWLRLRSRPTLPDRGRALLVPAVEDDVLETLQRALDGRAAWQGWYEVVGPEPFTLAELAGVAARTPPLRSGAGDWEPPPQEWRDHRLMESAAWSAHFDLAPRLVSEHAGSWS